MFQITTLFLRDSVEDLPAFTVSLDGVALNCRVVEKPIACIHSFVRSPHFTQCDFFSDNGINLLVSAVNAAGSMRDQSTCEPWANVLPEGYKATLMDLMLWSSGGKRHGINQRDGSECAVWSHLMLGSHLVGLECGYQMLLRLARLNTCLILCLLGISPVVVVLQSHLEALEKESAREVRHPLSLLHPRAYLNLTTSQLFCQNGDECILKVQTLEAL